MPSAKWRISGQGLTSARDNHSCKRARRLLADQGRELVRQVQSDRQIGAGRPDRVQAGLGFGCPFLGATDPVEGELLRRGWRGGLRLRCVHPGTRLAGPAQSLGQIATDRGVRQPHPSARQLAMQFGRIDPPLGDAGVNPLAVRVHPRACGPPGPPVGAPLATEVATYRFPRHAELAGDLADRRPLAVQFMDPLESLDASLSLGQLGLMSR